jgi:hypothetical protein
VGFRLIAFRRRSEAKVEAAAQFGTILVEVRDEKLMTPMCVISSAKPNENPMK